MKLIKKENHEWSGFEFTAYAKCWVFNATEEEDGTYSAQASISLFNSQSGAEANDGTSFQQVSISMDGLTAEQVDADYLTEAALQDDRFDGWSAV